MTFTIFLPSFLHHIYFLPSFTIFLPSFLPSFTTFLSTFRYHMPSFLPSFTICLPSFLPSPHSFRPSFLHHNSFLPSFTCVTQARSLPQCAPGPRGRFPPRIQVFPLPLPMSPGRSRVPPCENKRTRTRPKEQEGACAPRGRLLFQPNMRTRSP